MTKGTRLAARLRPMLPRGVFIGLPVFVTLLIVGLFLALAWDPSLKPHQKQMVALLLGSMGLLCVVAFARALMTWLNAGTTVVELSGNPVAPGDEVSIFASQRNDSAGLRRFVVRIVGFRRKGRSEDERLTEIPIGSIAPEGSLGLRAQVEGRFRVPEDAAETVSSDGVSYWWAVEVRIVLDKAADLVERYAFVVRRPA